MRPFPTKTGGAAYSMRARKVKWKSRSTAMRTKPLVGVTPLYDNDRESVWMIPGYLEALSACGALPVILPFSPSDAALMVEECDGICSRAATM